MHKIHKQYIGHHIKSRILKKSYLACFLLSLKLIIFSKILDKRGFYVYTFLQAVVEAVFSVEYESKKKLDNNNAFHYNGGK